MLPVRDGALTLECALRSVLASRDVELELVCVNDGSTDATPRILEHWARQDSRVRVLHTPPHGLVRALNAGLACTRHARVARMDADDEMHPERLRLQAELLDRGPAALVGCQVESFREGGLRAGYRIYTAWSNALLSPDQIARAASESAIKDDEHTFCTLTAGTLSGRPAR